LEEEVHDNEELNSILKQLPRYPHYLPEATENNLFQRDGDIAYAGDWPNVNACTNAIQLEQYNYMMNYIRQSLVKDKKSHITYENLDKKEIKKYIDNHFIIPYVSAKISGRDNKAESIKENLIIFAKGSNFVNDIDNICDALNYRLGEKNMKLIDFYLNRIDALVKEEYEKISKIDKEIKSFSS